MFYKYKLINIFFPCCGFTRQIEEKYLLEIFCEVNMDVYDKAVGESFTKLAFEAVEKIINVGLLRLLNKRATCHLRKSHL